MSFLVDTDVASQFFRGVRAVTTKFDHCRGRLHLSIVTVAELKAWIYRRSTPWRFLATFEEIFRECAPLSVDDEAAKTFGRVSARLHDVGRPVTTPDLLIAATAVVHDLTLVTGNERHFAAIDGLRVENWLRE